MCTTCCIKKMSVDDHKKMLQIAKTIIGQGHLTPLSLNALNVHWDFDYCMSLYPLPDLVVIGDKAEGYDQNYKGCIVMNPVGYCTWFLDYVLLIT